MLTESPVCLVNGEATLEERTFDHGVITVRSIVHQGQTLETTVDVVRPGEIVRWIIIEAIVPIAPKRIENETMTREGGTLILAHIVPVTGGRDHLTIIVEMTIIRSVSVEEWKLDDVFSCPAMYTTAI